MERSGPGFPRPDALVWMSAQIRAASLKVFAFSAEGERIFEGVGGLDLVDRVAADEYGSYYIEVREDVLGDPEIDPRGRRARARSAGAPRP